MSNIAFLRGQKLGIPKRPLMSPNLWEALSCSPLTEDFLISPSKNQMNWNNLLPKEISITNMLSSKSFSRNYTKLHPNISREFEKRNESVVNEDTDDDFSNKKSIIRVGIDVGSTTVKIAALNNKNEIIFKKYERHRADVRSTIVICVKKALDSIEKMFPNNEQPQLSMIVTGSGGLALSQWLTIPFIQEVVASTTAVKHFIPQTDVAIELGGEDAKITYFKGGVEQRMNGTCAGGTGAFIDQMSALLETDSNGLNQLAKNAQIIYPIAARCGVFAKTDVQPLINEGARREDIAASIYQAVVSQTISGLACGKPIRGNVAFLGGPLHFLDQLRERFIKTLHLDEKNHFEPENAELFVALGAALSAGLPQNLPQKASNKLITIDELRENLKSLSTAELHEVRRLDPLFKNEKELNEFRKRHAQEKSQYGDIKTASGPVFLGIDAGSTTTKTVLIDQDGKVLWKFYDVNGGNPVQLAVKVLKELYSQIPQTVHIARSVSTGYGESLFQSALGVDAGEVETIAHYKAADFFLPGVEFLLDIGGQDMKCLTMKDGAISSIQLNEACSSGCGSFLDNFARSLGLSISEFSKIALLSKTPVDLGNRCTVFMNSRVKQAQKEGASVGDISAGLSYSVIKNALFKVIKLRNTDTIKDKKIVVQGGTFNNDAVLRAFEKIAGHNVIRPDIAGHMGAYGAALIARDQWREMGSNPKQKSTIATPKQLESFKVDLKLERCGGCQNNCLLTINTFTTNNSKRQFVTGNRCERGLEKAKEIKKVKNNEKPIPNLFRQKLNRLFKYKPLPKDTAPRGEVGIPRVLNMYENYPLWFTFFTKLGFHVHLSPLSNRRIYERGLESIPSESVCYPGKITHGHIETLLKDGVKFIFYPCAPYEIKEDQTAGNHFNCPIVTSYPEVLRNNIDCLRQDDSIIYMNPFLPINNKKRLGDRLIEELSDKFNIPPNEIKEAVESAWEEQEKFRNDVHEMGVKAIEEINQRGLKGIVLSGRPYHLDPEINHGIPELINGLGLAVLTEDSIAQLSKVERPLRIVDQWTYHNRLYRAAQYVTTNPNLELVQFTSFGCGLDAVTSDQVEEILKAKGRMYTLIKIDEGSNLGAVRIRMRSLIAAMNERYKHDTSQIKRYPGNYNRVVFDESKRDYTILAPQMSPLHFRIIKHALKYSGFNFEILPEVDSKAVDVGLQYVNNDACYPSIIVTGQMIAALKSGKYDLNKTALLITQTGGGCRATNYIGFIRRALSDNGWGHVPVIGLSVQSLEKSPGFNVGFKELHRIMMGLVYGDVLMRCLYRTRPYELVPGSANALYEKYNERCIKQIKSLSFIKYNRLIREIIEDFDRLPLRNIRKPRIGIVGEILVKFHPTANNDIVSTIESEGAEAVVPDLADFFSYCITDGVFNHKKLSDSILSEYVARVLVWYVELYRWQMKRSFKASKRFTAPKGIFELQKEVDDIVQLGHVTGEGWLLTAEMVELIKEKVPSIACVQPFACLPNHVTGKGMIKELKRRFPSSNISAIDYDPGASEVNQLNRLKLLLENAPNGTHPDETKVAQKSLKMLSQPNMNLIPDVNDLSKQKIMMPL
ncbi:CoA-substrate-specific enzyme activase [Tritrichomonas foetus]|uniref:N-acetyl-D-glucosamine kinase n=1 Tax=Tritrichomonas foetus TaxID=1144522 RepID=A0A1J4K5M2_9EUKA|nr:CoA-substrate-specific enzyme activase [Tritrichomonas foetus]|eukprot:OHT04974.1 CoA-substrate-specific enzyme activase [Tritrichomonas foetus]